MINIQTAWESEGNNKKSIQRLTAIWAFIESGLGGMMHALKIPFTGLVVGGMAVLLITLISFYAKRNHKIIFQCLIIVLLVKGIVSPHSPVAAYIAVSFQALIGYIIYQTFQVTRLSILCVCIIAMMESALQKMLMLTLFFGKSFWNALDSLIEFAAKIFGMTSEHGSFWLMTLYLSIYFVGGIVIAYTIHSVLNQLLSIENSVEFKLKPFIENGIIIPKRKKNKFGLFVIIFMFILTSLFFLAEDSQNAWVMVYRSLTWTLSALLIWYIVVNPLLTKLIQGFLNKKKHRYSEEVAEVLSLMPMFQLLIVQAWNVSSNLSGIKRVRQFCLLFIHWSLTSSIDDLLTEKKG